MCQLQVLRELQTGQYKLLDLGVDPWHHGGEGELLGEGGGLQNDVLVGEAGRDVLVLHEAVYLYRVVVICLENLQELLDPPRKANSCLNSYRLNLPLHENLIVMISQLL